MKKIVHFSSVHKRHDIRIFLKECITLAQAGHEVTFVVADGGGSEVKSGVNIVDVGKPSGGRIGRMLNTTKAVYRCVNQLDADIYHFHDPELIPVGLKLKRSKSKAPVIFDSHENYADDIQDKPYIPPFLRSIISDVYRFYERRAVKKLDAIIAATPSIRAHFERMGVRAIDINNYPFEDEFSPAVVETGKKYDVVYIGTISEDRGVSYLVNACALDPKKSIVVVGSIPHANFADKLKESAGWSQVHFLGQVSRETVRDILASAKVAVINFLPTANHVESQPNKMFEYMSAGLPVISSNFPLWKKIIEGNSCGICVDPQSAEEISTAINSIVLDPELAKRMGKNGRRAVLENYNWRSEGVKLMSFYSEILSIEK